MKLHVFYRQILAHMVMLPCYMAMGSAGLGGDTQYTLYFKNCGCMATEKMHVLEQPWLFSISYVMPEQLIVSRKRSKVT